jgi:hypothetical protein
MASDARRHRQLGRRHAAWRWAVAELAAELLYLADARPEEIWRLQKEALVPLELDLARARQPASPKVVLKQARAALYRARHLNLNGPHEGAAARSTSDRSTHWALRKTEMADEVQSCRQGPARVVEFVMYTLVLAGVATALAFASGSTSGAEPLYVYYKSRVAGLANTSMQSREAFRWMTGGASAPGWERGRGLPAFALPWTVHDPGGYVGALFSSAPGTLISRSKGAREAAQASGALVDRASGTVFFRGGSVHLVMAALPGDRFEAAGLVSPVVVVQAGAQVSIKFLNEGPASAHGLVLARAGLSSSWEPMAMAKPAFKGAAVWFLGDMAAGRAHVAVLNFTASVPGHYQYLDPVPGQARAGMAGDFIVKARL